MNVINSIVSSFEIDYSESDTESDCDFECIGTVPFETPAPLTMMKRPAVTVQYLREVDVHRLMAAFPVFKSEEEVQSMHYLFDSADAIARAITDPEQHRRTTAVLEGRFAARRRT